jgi:hypothetical protein
MSTTPRVPEHPWADLVDRPLAEVVDLDARRPQPDLSPTQQAVADGLDEIRAEYQRAGDPLAVALCDVLRRALLERPDR